MISRLCQPRCVFCDTLSGRQLDLCFTYEHELPFLQNCCRRCAHLLPQKKLFCGECLSDLPLEIKATVLFCYVSPIDQLIMNLKFRSSLISANILGNLLSEHLFKQY